ncbi:MAG: response regulator transcription factor [Actinomycetes bacterium]
MPNAKPAAGEHRGFARSILVVEDEPLLRDLIAGSLEARGFAVSSASSPSEAVREFREVDPDGVVMDIDLGPGPNGFDLAERFTSSGTGVAIVFLTNLPDPRFAGRTADQVPRGVAYLRKEAVEEIEVLIEAVDSTLRGAVEDRMRHDRDPDRPLGSLTRRQVEILRLVALGKTNVQIAELRGTTVKAVERTVARALTAIGIDGELGGNRRVDAARHFIRMSGAPLPLPDGSGSGS